MDVILWGLLLVGSLVNKVFKIAPRWGAMELTMDAVTIAVAAYALLSLLFTKIKWSEGSTEWPWFRRLLCWKWLRAWVEFEVKREAPNMPIEMRGPQIYAVHPHGFFPLSVTLEFALNAKSRCKIATTGIYYKIPVFRNVMAWGGCVEARRDIMEKVLDDGKDLVVLPGGVREMAMYETGGRSELYLGHEGFLKMAWKKGIQVVPCISKGETDLYLAWKPFPRLLALCINYLGLPFPIMVVPFVFPQKLTLEIGRWIRPRDHADYESFRRAFVDKILMMTSVL